MGRGAGWISHSVSLRPLLPCPYMVMAELEDARPRPKFTSFSPVLKRHQQTRVQNVFLWLPCVVPVNNKMNNVTNLIYFYFIFGPLVPNGEQVSGDLRHIPAP